jgi:cell division protein ZapA
VHEETIRIGGRDFSVACNQGEEAFLQAAARMLDAEAQAVVEQAGRIPEARMLLMAGLLLADKTAAAEERLIEVEARLSELEAELDAERRRPLPPPERVQVAVVPPAMVARMSELAAQAEAIAARIEEKAVQ